MRCPKLYMCISQTVIFLLNSDACRDLNFDQFEPQNGSLFFNFKIPSIRKTSNKLLL